jgi:mannosyl-3-phosphoglycerate phosphatase
VTHVVFTDVDGTLLDHGTYRYDPARKGISILHDAGIPLVLVSSKTHAELTMLHRELSLSAPFVFENGGGIVWPGEKGRVEQAGKEIAELQRYVPELLRELGEEAAFVTDMDIDEIARVSGLPPEKARFSLQRRFSLPFILHSGRSLGIPEMNKLNRRLQSYGCAVTKGDRFFHFLSRESDKGAAVKKVVEYYRRERGAAPATIGIGDSENDLPMLREVDMPVLVRRWDGSAVDTDIPNVLVTGGIGPSGFTEAIKSILGERK